MAHRARTNAIGSRQSLARAWAVWGWVCPVVSLWFPLQMMSDIQTAGLPRVQRRGAAWLRGLWWACWLAAWATAITIHGDARALTGGMAYGSFTTTETLGSTLPSALFGAAAAILLAAIVHNISSRQDPRS